jgi:NAD(P)-dependent dehydrogenase (short-subunit alcohol dehydrogenase family)
VSEQDHDPKPPRLALPELGSDHEAGVRAQAETAIAFLESIRDRRALLSVLDEDQRSRLLQAAGQVARPDPWAKRELAKASLKRRDAQRKAADDQVLSQTGIRKKRREHVFVTPSPRSIPVLPGVDIDQALADDLPQAVLASDNATAEPGPGRVREERSCYVCKKRFHELHHFYDSMCGTCAELNWQKRHQTADLSGRVALVTGARVKIGYQAGILMLRAGARVIVTTRFPRDAAARYAAETDFAQWGHRLEIHGLDLRHTPSVEVFARHMNDTLDRLDFIINNACQTVRRPAGFYSHLVQGETLPVAQLSPDAQQLLASYEAMCTQAANKRLGQGGADVGTLRAAAQAVGLQDPAALSQLALLEEDLERSTHIFPAGQLDQDLQQIDLRARNSWRMPLADVSAVELLEVQLVNAVAPFILNARLKPLMLRVPTRDKHIVNVSAMEGQFYRSFKTDKHPHTNMAKAALNMMTRTSARDYVQDGIHMNSVDTGWVTDEDPAEIAARKTAEHGFHPPLDIVDGAARICDPIFDGFLTNRHVWGLFLKDYMPTDW